MHCLRFRPGAAFLLLLAALFPAAPPAIAAGDALDLSAYRGKVVYVDFWASWCTPCRASFPWMNALQAELGDTGLVIIGVNTGDVPEDAARFLAQTPADFEIVTDDGTIASSMGLVGMPMAYVYDREGTLVSSHVGFTERDSEARAMELRKLLDVPR